MDSDRTCFDCDGGGQCLNLTRVCDGTYDCLDRTDESPRQCEEMSQPYQGECYTEVYSSSMYAVLMSLAVFVLAIPLARLSTAGLTWLLGNYFVALKNKSDDKAGFIFEHLDPDLRSDKCHRDIADIYREIGVDVFCYSMF